MPSKAPPSPSTRKPCENCGSKGKHRENCPKFGSRSAATRLPLADRMEKLADTLRPLDDLEFAARLKVHLDEAQARRRRIQHEAAERLSKLDDALDRVMPRAESDERPPTLSERVMTRVTDATRSADPMSPPASAPVVVRGQVRGICGAFCPQSANIKCTQTTFDGAHDGDHYNATHKKSWPQRRKAAEA